MELRTIRKADVPEYLRTSAFFLALDGEEDEEFSIATTYFKEDTLITDQKSLRNLLHTLRFWGVDIIPLSVCDAAFSATCLYFVSVASEFKRELTYLAELIQLRSTSSGRRHWCRISDVAARKGHLSCVEYVFKRTKAFFNAAYDVAAHGHAHILRFIAQNDGKLEEIHYEVGLRHQEVVICLYTLQIPWPRGYADDLAAANSLAVLRFALTHGCPIHDYTLCRARSAECVQILVQCGGYQLNEQSTSRAAQAGLEVLKYVHAQGCPLTIHTACRAAQHNKFDVLKYLHDQDCPCDGTCLQEAERNYFLNPYNRNTERENSKCMSYLRSQFDFEQKCFKDRDAGGFALTEEITPLP
eukprot:gene18424-20977_t